MSDKKVETEILIHNINEEAIILEIDSYVFLDDIMKSFIKRYNSIDKQTEGSRF